MELVLLNQCTEGAGQDTQQANNGWIIGESCKSRFMLLFPVERPGAIQKGFLWGLPCRVLTRLIYGYPYKNIRQPSIIATLKIE